LTGLSKMDILRKLNQGKHMSTTAISLNLTSKAEEEFTKLLEKQVSLLQNSGSGEDDTTILTGNATMGYQIEINSDSSNPVYSLTVSRIKERRALSERNAAITKTVNNGEMLAGLVSICSGVFSYFKGDKVSAAAMLSAGGAAVFDCLKSWIIDYLKTPSPATQEVVTTE
jgi:hypothetical protein